MKRISRALLLLSLAVAASTAAWAQQTISSIRVYTDAPGARFLVDGTTYYGSQTFTWPRGSKHVIEFPIKLAIEGGTAQSIQESLDGNTQYTFGGWTDSTGLLTTSTPVVNFTADPSITFLKATAAAAYRVQIRFSSFPAFPDGKCPIGTNAGTIREELRTGVVFVAGNCYASNTEVWLPLGTTSLGAYAFPGYVFTGWSVNGGTANPFIRTFTLNGPVTVVAAFTQSRRVQFLTEPAGLEVLVDRTPTPTSDRYTVDRPAVAADYCQTNLNLPLLPPFTVPALCYGEFDFLPGSSHTLGARSPQYDNTGKMWVFESFSNGVKENESMTVPTQIGGRDIVTARFKPGMQATFNTNPVGLKLDIDGRSNWQQYNFAWGQGSTHTVSAPASQTDSKGRRWVFKNWSNGGTASQTITVNEPIRWTANYEILPQVTIDSVPAGLSLVVDGAECKTPCRVDKAAGSQVAVEPARTIAISNLSRLQFVGWSDGSPMSRTITVGSDTEYVSAAYETAYKMTIYSDPGDGVNFNFEPASSDGWFPADANIKITAQPKGGYRFRRWDGDAAGTFTQAFVAMAGPRTIVALLEKVPFIAPAGVRNAAGETPDGAVAPGSIISILGESLAPHFEEGRVNPLPQAIADTTVRVGSSLLPLVFVSPTEIRAQVLSILPEGEHTLTVKWEGHPEISANFRVARNAPGLFAKSGETEPIASATHADGTPVTREEPAQPGEIVTVFGTGFGPYDKVVIDGFLVTSSGYSVVDPIQVAAGDFQVTPETSGAATGMVGTSFTRFRVPDDMPGGTIQPVTITVNGKASNTVLLPIR